ncbi:MAG: hypothetical protein KDK62_08160 [Chlamydiia bacterium]|nr:hypothetical protein [Chlamydiia bacterium]
MIYAIALLLFLFSCSSESDRASGQQKSAEHLITRRAGEALFLPPPPEPEAFPQYPWEKRGSCDLPWITKEYFRCKGNPFNPPRSEAKGGETLEIADCGGSEKHSLPLIDGKEGVYPILIDLLNYLQERAKKRVVITSAHRCPDHNTYVNSAPSNQTSKHLIAAEVSFYVQGYEEMPESIVRMIQDYYQTDSQVKDDRRYTVFTRYEKEDTNVSTPPWMNQEIFIKLFKKDEGRDFDNRHPYPYLSIQVRYDREKKARVFYSWDKAYNNFLRY